MSGFIDARAVPSGTVIETDVAIVGGGAAGISLALALAPTPLRMVMLESGGLGFDSKAQALYSGEESGYPYLKLDASRLRYLGGSTNHWGGWSRPLSEIDFEARDWMPHSGWPFPRREIAPYFKRAQSLVECGPFVYDHGARWARSQGAPLPLAEGGVYTSWFQFSRMRGSVLPTHFGQRYGDDIKRIPRLSSFLHANVTAIRLAPDAGRVERLDIATLSGKRFTLKPKLTVLACGAMENARLLLASNDVASQGIGNGADLVGRFFADHPIPRDTATLVVFDGQLAPFYTNNAILGSLILRATFSPTEDFQRRRKIPASLTTVENEVKLDELGQAAVVTVANVLGVDATGARAFSTGCGMELVPDPDRRLTLSGEHDALGLPRLKLHMRVAQSNFDHYRTALKELGRQLLAARIGMIRLNRKSRQDWIGVMDWGNHHMGTTRMAADPKQGVVDGDCKVHGIANLFVAGSSVFPTYGASNPTLNLVALALRLATHVRKQFP
ncbi:MAG: GMC family oxidoreductase [Alphaproteobacteria bacterium]|nr:GMC family oxidoreductase [Alphaproteobacteria bacterium]